MMQLPLPKHIDEQLILGAISVTKDVDGEAVGEVPGAISVTISVTNAVV